VTSLFEEEDSGYTIIVPVFFDSDGNSLVGTFWKVCLSDLPGVL